MGQKNTAAPQADLPPQEQQASAQAAPAALAASSPAAPERQISKSIDIDLARLKAIGMVPPDGERTAVAEDFRLIKRPLIESAFNPQKRAHSHPNLIMVTSALPGEGKTFCAVNLAISIAMELDHTVLLVDADVARPSIPKALDLKCDQGLMDVLLDDKLDLSDVLLRTNIESLALLPAGRPHKHATELLASQAMSRFLDDIAKRYPDRLVIFDSPPVLLTSEARVLASQVGQIVLVVEAETTTQHAVQTVIRQIGDAGNVSLIYNKAPSFPVGEYYGRYYG